jgi:hypothetical protein
LLALNGFPPAPEARGAPPLPAQLFPPPASEVAEDAQEEKNDFFTILLGASLWSEAGDVEPGSSVTDPERFGEFETLGWGIEIAYHRRILLDTWGDLRVGVDFGIFLHENEESFDAALLPSLKTIHGSLNARCLYFTPGVRWITGRGGPVAFSAGAGAGYYTMDVVEQLGDGMEADEYYEKSTVGGYLCAGARVPLDTDDPDGAAFCLEVKVHFVRFGDFDSFGSDDESLRGPIFMMQAGFSF